MPRLQVRMEGHSRERSLGWLAVAWVEHFVRHGVGEVRGKPMILDQDFYDFMLDAYALDADGRRLYDTVILSRPKGTAKSELAGGITLFETHGPCRFAGWASGGETFTQHDFTYTYQPGEPMGHPVQDAFARLLATEEGQTGNTYRNVRANLEDEGAPLHDVMDGRRDFDCGVTRALLPNGAEIRPSTAGAASKDGGLETFAVADETHLYHGTELVEMFDTVDRNLPKRKLAEPWMLCTTTMFQDGQGSVAERQYKLAQAVRSGRVPNPRVLFDHLEGGTITDLSDVDRLREVLHEAYANRDWIDYDRYVIRATDPTKDPAKFRRYNLNQQAAAAEAYVTPQEVAAVVSTEESPVQPLTRGDVVTLGFDYAPGNRGGGHRRRRLRIPDATAMVACRLSDMSLHPLGIWEASEAAARDGWAPPMVDVEATFHKAFTDYKVVGVFADPTGVETYLDRWTAKYLPRLKVRASVARPMYRYMSGKAATRSGADVDALYEAIAGQTVRLAADQVFIRHFLNARRSVGRYGTALFKKNPESPEKIDAAVAAVLAHAAAREALNRGVASAPARVGTPRRIY